MKTNTTQLMLSDLARSGLDAADAKRARFQVLDVSATNRFTNGRFGVPAYRIPYFSVDGAESEFSRLKLLQPVKYKDKESGKTKVVKYYQQKDTRPEVYLPPGQKYQQLLDDTHVLVGITEGEKKSLKATKDLELTIGLGGIWSFASKDRNIDLLSILKRLAAGGREIIITFDGDGHTNRKVRKAESAFAARLTEYGARVWIRVLPPGTALDELLVERGPEEVGRLTIRPFDAKSHISFIRGNKGSSRQKKENISRVIGSDLSSHGRFLRTPTNGLLFFDNDKHRLIGLDDPRAPELRHYLNDSYGVNGSETEYNFVYEDVATTAHEHGVRAEPHFFSHFDRKSSRLYIAATVTDLLRIDSKGFTRIPNGTDGIYIRVPSQMTPIPDVEPSKDRAAFDYLLHLANLAPGHDATPDQMRLLLEVFLWAVLFGAAALPTRPIVVFHGPKGAAKTTEGRAALKTFFGPHADVTVLDGAKLDGMDAAMTSQHLVVLDNVDGRHAAIENRLAIAATGGDITRRRLYTTMEEVRLPVRSFLMATTRAPDSFTRDDVVDRLLYMPCERREEFMAEGELMARIIRQRGDWWAYALHMLPKLIKSLARPHPAARELRMQDFANFAIGIAAPLGRDPKEVIAALRAGESEKLAFVAEQSPLPEALATIATHAYRSLPTTALTATQLLDELRNKIPSFAFRNPQQLGQRIRNELQSIQQRVELTATYNRKTKTWRYLLGGRVSR